ncbi:MAG TPA: IS5 family transposase [Paludibacteraceae bacterium]|nr:IS5 family transposase [Paludibacteraceae bacterium]
MERFEFELPFSYSMLSKWRDRIDLGMIMELIEEIGRSGGNSKADGKKSDEAGKGDNKGELIIDATCVPSDIRYPKDTELLNEGREKQEKIIDIIYAGSSERKKKPRTYRKTARKKYLIFAKNRNPSQRAIRNAIKAQIGYVRRNFKTIDQMLEKEPGLIELLSEKQKRELETIRLVYQQQEEMYREKKRHVENRIVSISQPYIRPIVRGKAKNKTEFGAKISISVIDGYSYLDRVQFDSYNESEDLWTQIEAYKLRTEHYPEAVLADQIYRTKENRRKCAELGIRLSGPKLGRKQVNQEKEERKIAQMDSRKRNAVEGKFGEGKRFYGMDCIKGKTEHTCKVMIALYFVALNLAKKLRDFLSQFLDWILILCKFNDFINFGRKNRTVPHLA